MKTGTQLVEEKPPVKDQCGICGCGHERRVALGVVVPHQVWIPALAEMVPCPGAGRAPSRATT
jgi:hypothetical protein